MFQYKVAPVIETPRLIIRIVSLDDATDFFEFCSDPNVTKYLTFSPYNSLSHTKRIINNMINAYIHGSDVNFSVILKENYKVIGSISLSFKEFDNIAEIGYLFNSLYWNKGYGDEALKKVIDIAFNYYNLDMLIASYISLNKSSEKLLLKNNFIIDNVLKKSLNKNNQFYDIVNCYLVKQNID